MFFKIVISLIKMLLFCRTCLNDVNSVKELFNPDRYDKAMRPCEDG